MKTFQEYTDLVLPLAKYPERGANLIYPILGLVGEAGEAAEKVKKLWRDHGITSMYQVKYVREYKPSEVVENLRAGLIKELGDVLWYLNAAANEIGTTLEEVATINASKLLDRTARGVIGGSGDNR